MSAGISGRSFLRVGAEVVPWIVDKSLYQQSVGGELDLPVAPVGFGAGVDDRSTGMCGLAFRSVTRYSNTLVNGESLPLLQEARS
jgi:hypothetical protein